MKIDDFKQWCVVCGKSGSVFNDGGCTHYGSHGGFAYNLWTCSIGCRAEFDLERDRIIDTEIALRKAQGKL